MMRALGLAMLLAYVSIPVESGYIFTVPQVLLAGSEEQACLTLQGFLEDVTVNIMLIDQIDTVLEQVFIFPGGQSACVSLKIPFYPHPEDRHVNLLVTGISSGYNFSSSTPVIIRNDPTITFIQTDKSIYKPGQTVKFRILTIDDNLRSLLLPVSEVVILDPNGIRMRQWTDITGEDGLLSLEMELSEEPVLGEWKIEATINYRKETQIFTVEEYVLPKFEVIIKPPPFMPANSPSITGEVCAQYTYGKRVRGVMEVELCVRSPHLFDLEDQPPCDKLIEKIDGCKMFSIDSKLVNLGSADYPLWDHRVYINASVTESDTGVTEYGVSNSAKVIQEALKLDFGKSSRYFKPGLPYKGKVRVRKPNGEPARDEPIKVAAVDYESGVRAEDVFVSNSEGEVYFVLPGELLLLSKELTLLAEAIRYKDSENLDNEDRHVMYQPTALVRIQAWYSRSKSFIQIFPVEEAVECNKDLTVGIAYTTTPGTTVKFHYQVVSRGNIVTNGEQEQYFNLHVFNQDDTAVLTLQEGGGTSVPPQPPPVGNIFDQSFLAGENPFASDSELMREIEREIAQERFASQAGQQEAVPDPYAGRTPVEEDFIEPEHYQPLGNKPALSPDPYAGLTPVEEDFIEPKHYQPLGSQPSQSPDPYAGRTPVEEDFIKPKHYQPLGSQPSQSPDPYAGRTPVEEDFIKPKHYQPLGSQPSQSPDPYAGRTPVEEDFIKPKHYQPLGSQPSQSPDPYAGRTPVEEDFIKPKHYQPLGSQPSQSPDPYAGRTPVEEDFIEPKHYQPLGSQPSQSPDPYAGRTPVEEDFIEPKHYQPLGNKPALSPDPYAGRTPVEEDFIKPKHYQPLGSQPSQSPDPNAGRKPVEEDFIQPEHFQPLGARLQPPPVDPYAGRKPVEEDPIRPKHYQPLQMDDISNVKNEKDNTDHPDEDLISEGDRVFIKQEETTYEESTHFSHLQLTIPVTMAMSPEAQLLVYHIRPQDGEIVADAITFKVKRCFQNQVSFKFKKPKARPGKATTLRVNADSGSLCGIGVVDKSVHLAGTDNQMSPEKVFRQLSKYNIGRNFGSRSEDQEYCRGKMLVGQGEFPPIRFGPPGLGPLRKKRQSSPQSAYYSPYVDAIKAFRTAGLTTLTDLDIQTRPCDIRDADDPIFRTKFDEGIRGVPGPGGPFPIPLDTAFGSDEDFDLDGSGENLAPIRSYFPETWLWELMRIGDAGLGLLTRSIPDTITEWVGGAVCLNPKSGLGVSPPASITTFQHFFISYTLPYSVIRGERIPIIVTAFSYLKDCLEIKISMRKSRRFEIPTGSSSESRCLCGGESASQTFYIIPKKLGKTRISVDSRAVKSTGICKNRTMSFKGLGARDRVRNYLLVEAEGIPKEYTYSAMACPREQPGWRFEDNIKLKLPQNVIKGSERAQFSIIGDLMGLTLKGLEKLIQLPTGCGEQNMLNFAPIIYVLQYLKATKQLSQYEEDRAKDFMRKGYQSQLTYRHKDGSYSAFGDKDETGSMWLTAFVVKSFAQARNHIYIDPDDLKKSVTWLQVRQLESGCFPHVGQVIHKEMKGGLASGNQGLAALTAYVLTAMLEANTSRQHPSVQRAVRCLEATDVSDTYAVALSAYALTLYDINSMLRSKLMNKLYSNGRYTDGLLHWERKTTPAAKASNSWREPYGHAPALEVEMTSYALLAYISGNQPNSIMLARPVVQWLTKQRNAEGGFVSTQDTVVALQAIALYSSKAYRPKTNLTCIVQGNRFNQKYQIVDANKFALHTTRVRRLPNELKVITEGIGCALIQTNVRYNVPSEPESSPPFHIKVNIFRSKSDINNCKKRSVNICTSYVLSESASNMAIVEVKMVTGWVPIKETIAPVLQETRLGVKKFEIEDNSVNFYFEEMTPQRRCFEFEVFQNVKLTAPKEAHVKVYDYYETDHSVMTMYNIKTTCGTKEEIPFEVTDHVGPLDQHRGESANVPFFPEQRREPILPGLSGPASDPFFIPQRRVQPVLPPFLLKKLKAAKEKQKQTEKVHCPVCVEERPDDYPQRYCSAQHAYKTYTGRDGTFPLKLQADFRPKRGKAAVNGFARFSLSPACQCDVLKQKGRVMVLTPSDAYTQGTLLLDARVTVVRITSAIEKESRKLSVSCAS
ncbi:murinoglobulin-2-like [Liolophura sinensis]|uniref:murinoglobulin-2-like n=1 Tax=Liolophura sinensis TaxID=3198878 RepID=UPI0031598E2C